MPQDVRDHVRYPEDLFEVQRALLAKYRVDDPVTFYNVRDQWTVPTDPTAASGDQPPYYLVADKPLGNGTTSEFQLTSPMKVNNRDNLAAYITVDSDAGPITGRSAVFRLPTDSAIQGPTQVFNRFSFGAGDLEGHLSAQSGRVTGPARQLAHPAGRQPVPLCRAVIRRPGRGRIPAATSDSRRLR